ncbi:MAG: Rrf2 family transcriptional regulator [Planctomycetota bacterium]
MFSKTTEYGFRAAVFLCEARGRRVPAQEIAETTHVPVRYMSKVLQTLTEAGLIESQRGPTGGFWLTRNPDELSLLDIVEAISPIERAASLPTGQESHHELLGPLYDQLDDLASVAINKLRATSLSSLMKQNSASDASRSEPNRMAAAGMVANGAAVNRMSTNGMSSNGALSNGASSKGASLTGAGSDGMATHAAGSNGFAASHANGHHGAETDGHH